MFSLWTRVCVGLCVGITHLQRFFESLCCASRITLHKMPSIRETLGEMGVSVEQVLSEMAKKSAGDTFNKTVPTPLTNYLDVGPVRIPSGVREVAGVSCFTLFLGFFLNRLSILGKSASALPPRCSTWCLTQAQQICGCPHKAALPFPPPVVSVPPSGPRFKLESVLTQGINL